MYQMSRITMNSILMKKQGEITQYVHNLSNILLFHQVVPMRADHCLYGDNHVDTKSMFHRLV